MYQAASTQRNDTQTAASQHETAGSSQSPHAKKASQSQDFASGEAALKPPGLGSPGGQGLQLDVGYARYFARDFAQRGVTDEAFLTDQVFYRVFPWLNGQKLAAKSPEAKAWVEVRDKAVRVEVKSFQDQMKKGPDKSDKDKAADEKADAEVVPGEATINPTKGAGAKTGTGDAYLNQNDNSYKHDEESWYNGSAGSNTCNMTAISMALISIAGSEDVAKQAVALYLKKKGPRAGAVAKVGGKVVSMKKIINDSALIAKVQLEDLVIAAAVIGGGYDAVTSPLTMLNVAKASGLVKGGSAPSKDRDLKDPAVLARAKTLLAEGKRVIVGTVNHYVYLTAVLDTGILVHDPAGARVTVSGDPKYLWPGKASDKLGVWDKAIKSEPLRSTTLRRLSHNPEALALFEQECQALDLSGSEKTAARAEVKKDHPGFIATGANNFYSIEEFAEYNCRIRVILEPTESAKEEEGQMPKG
jgi:hypothetical protein